MPKYLKWDYTKAEGTFYPIPASKYYVIATDFFNSGFGYAYNKINVVVVNCNFIEETIVIEQYMEIIPTLTNITTVNKLLKKDKILYTLMNNWREKAGL